MAKTKQVLKMNVLGAAFCVTFTPGRRNAYRFYRTWWDGGNHKKLIAEYANFESILYHLLEMGCPEFKRDYFPVD